MKNKKILSSILVLTLVFALSSFVQAKPDVEISTYTAVSDFEDMVPALEHNKPYVDTVISCNMVLKPKTQIDLSRLCSSAVTNVNYYFNGSTSNIQKGPDYNNTVKEETFYPASKRISNSYLGGTISYQVGSELQTKKSTGEKINLSTPMEGDTAVYKTAVIISSITKEVDLGVETIITVPTGDQSQPDWVGSSGVFPGFEGVIVDWEFNFGYIDDNNSSGSFGFFKAKSKNIHIINLKAGLFNPSVNGGKFKTATNFLKTSLNEDVKNIVKSAKKLSIQYNEDQGACDGDQILMEDGWQNLSSEDFAKFTIEDDGNLSYPNFMNAWIRVYAVTTEPSDNDYRPAKRTRIKSRIGTYGGFKFNNLVDGDVVKIYNVSGQKVAELTVPESSEGFEWKGRKGTNNDGDWAKSGIYIYQIKLKEKSKIISGTIVFAY